MNKIRKISKKLSYLYGNGEQIDSVIEIDGKISTNFNETQLTNFSSYLSHFPEYKFTSKFNDWQMIYYYEYLSEEEKEEDNCIELFSNSKTISIHDIKYADLLKKKYAFCNCNKIIAKIENRLVEIVLQNIGDDHHICLFPQKILDKSVKLESTSYIKKIIEVNIIELEDSKFEKYHLIESYDDKDRKVENVTIINDDQNYYIWNNKIYSYLYLNTPNSYKNIIETGYVDCDCHPDKNADFVKNFSCQTIKILNRNVILKLETKK